VSAAYDLRTYLLADTAVAAAIGARMYADALPQAATLPAVVYQVISRTHVQHLKGITTAGTVRVQLDCYADTRLTADAVAEAIVGRLRTLAATPAAIGAGSYVGDLEIQGPRSEATGPADGSDEWVYSSSMDVLLNIG
jgi:hypothetical protein